MHTLEVNDSLTKKSFFYKHQNKRKVYPWKRLPFIVIFIIGEFNIGYSPAEFNIGSSVRGPLIGFWFSFVTMATGGWVIAKTSFEHFIAPNLILSTYAWETYVIFPVNRLCIVNCTRSRIFCTKRFLYYKGNPTTHSVPGIAQDFRREKDLKGILMQIWKSLKYIHVNMKIICWRFHIKHHLLFKIYACEICERFVYKHSETID